MLTTHGVTSLDDTGIAELTFLESLLAEPPATPTGEDDSLAEHEHISAELYRLACLLYVKQALEPDIDRQSAQIQHIVAQFITNLLLLPPTSNANGILCWPLVVVGMLSVISTHQRLIGGRLRRIQDIWKSDIASKSTSLLSQKWRQDRISEGSTGHDRGLGCVEQARRRIYTQQRFNYPIVLL